MKPAIGMQKVVEVIKLIDSMKQPSIGCSCVHDRTLTRNCSIYYSMGYGVCERFYLSVKFFRVVDRFFKPEVGVTCYVSRSLMKMGINQGRRSENTGSNRERLIEENHCSIWCLNRTTK